MKLRSLCWCALVIAACSDPEDSDGGATDSGVVDTGVRIDTGVDAQVTDTGVIDRGVDAGVELDAAEPDAEVTDSGPSDGPALDAEPLDGTADSGVDAGADAGTVDTGPSYNCGLFSQSPGWTVAAGFRAVVIADQNQGLQQPVAVSFAGGAFGGLLYVVDQGNDRLYSVDVLTGQTRVVVTSTSWSPPPQLLTAITWDEDVAFDGNLYVADQGGDGDADSRIYRVTPNGQVSLHAAAPGPGLDDIYALTFAPPGSAYPPGLYVSGDTDGAGIDWGYFDALGMGTGFSEVAGIEGAVFDRSGRLAGQLLAGRPLGGGYAGDGSLTLIGPNGVASGTVAVGLGGVHAPAISPGGAFGQSVYAASWSTNRLYRIEAGVVTEVASGLSLTNYDANILAFASDGNVLFVADRLASRIVCIEPGP